MENITVIGLDLAKNVFQAHGANAQGRKIFSKKLKRAEVMPFFAALPPCLVGMEACCGAHEWARQLQGLGHKVKLMAPHYVKAFVQGSKTDARDAAAISEAAVRESIPAVPVRSRDSQQIQSIHRVREAWSKQRTATINQLRGLLAEFGFVMPSRVKVRTEIVDWKSTSGQEFGYLNGLLDELLNQLQQLEESIGRIDKQLGQILRDNAACRLIETIPGIGPITATAIVGRVGNAENFKDSRKFECALGLTPREHSSGGKQVLLGISKHGDGYLRKLLVHGARAVLNAKLKKAENADDWAVKLAQRRGHNIAVCALAAKNARRVWAMLRTGEVFRSDYALANNANA